MSHDILQHMPQHTLLTAQDEANLSVGVKDWLLLERHRQRLLRDLSREPTLAEWADSVSPGNPDEAGLRERIKVAAMVSKSCPAGNSQV